MKCANCRTEGSPAYTLKAHLDEGGDSTVDLEFCSFECLDTWT